MVLKALFRCLVILLLVGAASIAHAQIQKGGYYQNEARVRIFTFEFAASVPAKDIRAHAENLPYTSGRFTAAYYYPSGSTMPRDTVTLAKDVIQANELLYEKPGLSRWRFAYMRGFGGSSVFVDCLESPKDPLCRP